MLLHTHSRSPHIVVYCQFEYWPTVPNRPIQYQANSNIIDFQPYLHLNLCPGPLPSYQYFWLH